MNDKKNSGDIPLRKLGRTGVEVSALGFGGYHLGTIKSVREAVRLQHEAIDAGITFMDNAWEYHDGRSEELMGKAIHDRRERVFLMTKVCTHGRDRRTAMRQLEDSLRRLKTDYIDLWQIHEVVYPNAMSLSVATTVSGIDSLKVLRQNLRVARGFTPMSEQQMRELRAACALRAADGRFELYKTTLKHEGPIGRKQHGFPSEKELVA